MADKNMLIIQGGGPSAVINASLAGAITHAMASPQVNTIYGAINGLQGLLERRVINISQQITTDAQLKLLAKTPAHALGTSRYKLPHNNPAIFDEILAILESFNIGYLLFIGGNDSMDSICRLSAFFADKGKDIKAVGIPKTIDNDLAVTDHSPGFGSAAKFVATITAELYLDTIVYPASAVTIIEIMGRNAGWLAASSVLARQSGVLAPHLIYLPEVTFDPEAFLQDAAQLIEREKQIVIAVSEGIRLADGSYLAETGAAEDMFGHKTLGGVATVLEEMLKEHLQNDKLKTRAIQLNTLQRSAAHLGSAVDSDEAFQCGLRGAQAVLKGSSEVMISMHRAAEGPYAISYDESPLIEIANIEKKIPPEWITPRGNDVTADMVAYLKPLVNGESSELMQDGLPAFFRFDWAKTVTP